MKTVAAELAQLMMLATVLNCTRGPSHRITAETWLTARDRIAREMARSVGIIRKELGIVDDDSARAFRARQVDTGIRIIRQPGRRGIPVERR